MSAKITDIYRYPVKGMTAEALARVQLSAGEALPGDRRFALALAEAPFDPANPVRLSPRHCVTLKRENALARLRCKFDGAANLLTVADGGTAIVSGNLAIDTGRAAVESFIAARLAIPRPRLVEAPGQSFGDAKTKVVSLIGRESLRALERAMNVPLDPRRFRANLYFEGLPAWAEFDWVGRTLVVGAARLLVSERIVRCRATSVDPNSGTCDRDVPEALERHFGHVEMGVYATVMGDGAIAIGDSATLDKN